MEDALMNAHTRKHVLNAKIARFTI